MNSQTIDEVERLYYCNKVRAYGECPGCNFYPICNYLVKRYNFPYARGAGPHRNAWVWKFMDEMIDACEHYCTVIYAEGEV